jgi:ATP-dependent DNA helicase RecQ
MGPPRKVTEEDPPRVDPPPAPPAPRPKAPEGQPPRAPALDGSPSAPPSSPRPAPSPSSGGYVSTEEWTWRLLDRGFSCDEVAALRGLEPSAIIRHATWVALQGRPVPPSAFLSPDLLARWDSWHQERGTSPPPDPEAASLWALYLACLGTK